MKTHPDVISFLLKLAALEPSSLDEYERWQPLPALQIAQEAQRQGVAPWISHQIELHYADKEFLKPLKTALKPIALSTLAINEMNIALLQEIQSIFASKHITTTTLKGISLLLDLYPEPALRPIGDLDLYIASERVFEARDLLIAHGAKPTVPPMSQLHEANHAHVRSLTYKGRLVELHQRLYDIGNPWNPIQSLDQVVECFTFRGQQFNRLNKVYQAYHITTHLAYNMKMGGCRLGWFIDIALLFSGEKKTAHLLLQSLMQINKKANPTITQVIGYALPLMSAQAKESLEQYGLIPPSPLTARLLTPSEQITRNHKIHVLETILRSPGMTKKVKLLFREFFPDREYMSYFYTFQSRKGLIFAYLKRLTHIGK